MSLTCDRVRDVLLDATRQEAPELPHEHLESCDACRRFYEQLFGALRARREAPALDPRAVERMWSNLEAHAARVGPRRWWRVGWGIAIPSLAAAGLALLLFVWPSQTPVQPTYTVMAHAPAAVHRGSSVLALAGGESMTLEAGDRVVSGKTGSVVARLDRHRVVAAPTSELVLERWGAETLNLRLVRGKIELDVEPMVEGSARVRSPRAECTVLGTLFSVETTETADRVDVEEGAVVVRSLSGRSQTIRAGESATVGTDGMIRTPQGSMEREPATSILDADRLTPSRKAKNGKPRAESPTFDEAIAAGSCGVAERAHRKAEGSQTAEQNAEMLLRLAECYTRADDPERAQALSRRVFKKYPQTPAGGQAAFALGRDAAERGEAAMARRAFGTYLRHHPRGALAGNATYRLCVLAVEAGRGQEALRCLEQYRADYPGGVRVAETYLLQATVHRTLEKDCGRAIAAYEKYLERPGDLAKEARAWKRWCEQELLRKSP